MQQTEWVYCPVCGNKTRDQIREDAILINYERLQNCGELFKKISLHDDSYGTQGALVPHKAANELPGIVAQQ